MDDCDHDEYSLPYHFRIGGNRRSLTHLSRTPHLAQFFFGDSALNKPAMNLWMIKNKMMIEHIFLRRTSNIIFNFLVFLYHWHPLSRHRDKGHLLRMTKPLAGEVRRFASPLPATRVFWWKSPSDARDFSLSFLFLSWVLCVATAVGSWIILYSRVMLRSLLYL